MQSRGKNWDEVVAHTLNLKRQEVSTFSFYMRSSHTLGII